jgi:hypothetical protein
MALRVDRRTAWSSKQSLRRFRVVKRPSVGIDCRSRWSLTDQNRLFAGVGEASLEA